MKRFEKPILVTRPYLPPIGFYFYYGVPIVPDTYCNMCSVARMK